MKTAFMKNLKDDIKFTECLQIFCSEYLVFQFPLLTCIVQFHLFFCMDVALALSH